MRLVACATGTRASAPRWPSMPHAVTPAARRSGRITPCAPNAAADRPTAPRLRGSVTPSRAMRTARRVVERRVDQFHRDRRRHRAGPRSSTPWCTHHQRCDRVPARVTSRIGRSLPDGQCDGFLTRSSASMYCMTVNESPELRLAAPPGPGCVRSKSLVRAPCAAARTTAASQLTSLLALRPACCRVRRCVRWPSGRAFALQRLATLTHPNRRPCPSSTRTCASRHDAD